MRSQNKNIWAVVPSAGSGQRMGQAIPKQYLELNGRTVIEHTIATLLAEPRISKVFVCLAESDEYWPRLDYSKDLRVSSVTGGNTRAHSVMNGINELSKQADQDDWVLVHDAARPCLSGTLLCSFIDQLTKHKVGGILAMPSKDTVKQAVDNGRTEIETTLNRDRIWYAQTPQMFRCDLLKEALNNAIKRRLNITDEASAIEMAGYRPKLIEGEMRNLKVTTPEDLALASLLIDRD